MLAKNVNDDAGSMDDRGGLEFFASMLAPTGGRCCPPGQYEDLKERACSRRTITMTRAVWMTAKLNA
jgi:hypothetical protein